MIGMIAVNLLRRRARTLLTSVGIAVGVATIVALLSLTAGLKQSAGGLVNLGKADLGLFQKSVADPTASALPESLVARVRRYPGVAGATPIQLLTDAYRGDPSFILFGLDPGGLADKRLVILKGRRARTGEVMVGDTAAGRLDLRLGEKVKLVDRRYTISGIYHGGVTFEDTGGVMPLREVQFLAGREGDVTTVGVSLDPGQKAPAMTKRLERAFPGTIAISDPTQAARAGANGLLIGKAVFVIAVLALVIGGISVTNTMLMAVLERQAEFSLLSAVGWSPRQVAFLVLGEGIGVSLVGAALGLAIGLAVGELIVRASGAAAFVSPHITAWGLGRGLLVGVAIGVLGGLYPAWRVTRLRPVEALSRA